MSLELFPALQFFGKVWERSALILLYMFGIILQGSHLALGLCVGRFLITHSISLLIIGLFIFPISSWLNFGRLFLGNHSLLLYYPIYCHIIVYIVSYDLMHFCGISYNILYFCFYLFESFSFLLTLAKGLLILFASKKKKKLALFFCWSF